MWLPIALLGNGLLAVVGIIDKFILTKSVPKPVVFVFYSTIFILPFFLLLPFGVMPVPTTWIEYIIFAISGGCFALGLWTMYTAIAKSEVSRIGPLIGAAVPFFILFLSRFFLGEKLTSYALMGAILLIFGSLVISFEKKNNISIWHGGVKWALLAGLLFAISHVSAKYIYDIYGFFNGFIFTKLPVGVVGALLLFHPAVRAVFNTQPKSIPGTMAKKNQILLVAGNMALGVAGTVLLQYAMALGSVSLVNALAGVQYAMLIIFTVLVSKFFPQIISEEFSIQKFIHKILAVLLIAVGLGFLLIP